MNHHPWCNHFMGEPEGCSMCETLYRRYPLVEGETSEEMGERYFPDNIWPSFKIVNYGRL